MAYQASFVASILAGFESTIAALLAGSLPPECRAALDGLDTQIRALRVTLEQDAAPQASVGVS